MGQILFQIWILSFLFYQVDIIGSLSIDNLMVPFLFLAWFFVGDRGNALVKRARLRSIGYVTIVFLFLIVVEILKIEGTSEFRFPGFEHMKHYGYILIPLLYISNEKNLKFALISILALAVINSCLAFLGALGMGELFGVIGAESTRVPGLLRARGAIANFGDNALLLSFMLLMVWTAASHKIFLLNSKLAVRIILFLAMFAGVVAMQSRNIILSIVMVFSVYYWLRMMVSKADNGMSLIIPMIGVGVFLCIIICAVLYADVIMFWVTNMFGMSGEGTVRDRLGSYSQAVELLQNSWLFGLSPKEVAINVLFIAMLHNMWLGFSLLNGVVGAVLIFIVIVYGLMGALKLAKNNVWKEYGLVLFSFILSSLLFAPNFYPGHNAFFFWFCIGIALTARQTLYFTRQQLSGLIQDAGAYQEHVGAQPKARILKYKSTHS